ncbi:ornithine cyclodeaminase family protein [Pararhodobacter sp. SW119]|uniref:ornithine cyclodeaminase family protein n=1 Tax=Pararhodobacter sp. SW119 TaxID=2780075 RepID=UPI001AE0B4C8|nr:ornithine cyclodeaminase family protein [Pararhodobacter sp. SW119]
MRVLSHEDVATLLPMEEAIEVIERAMRTVSAGGAQLPLRSVVPVGGRNMMGVMPGAISDPPCYGVKIVSLFPENPSRGLSGHRGAIVLFEAETGGAVAMMDAGLLTAIRTAAASAVATRALARPESRVLTLIGTGEQAEHHLDAMLAVLPIKEVRVVGRRAEKAAAFAAQAGERQRRLSITHGTDAQSAIAGADVVCTLTSSPVPVLSGDWLEPGQHLNVVGASVPAKREIDDMAVLRSAVFCDYRPSFLAQAGEIVEMIAAGNIDEDHLRAEIGEVLSGTRPGRASGEDITLYRSLGIAAQDLAAADHVWTASAKAGRGQKARF